MEGVYHDLNLDKHFEHPDNRGWINLFQRWAWSSMFRFTWSVTASTFGARFQTFCEQKMKFRKYEVKIGIDKNGDPEGLEIKKNIVDKHLLSKSMADQSGESPFSEYLDKFWKDAENKFGFNRLESKLLVSLIKENRKSCTIYPIFIRVEDNPLKDKLKFDLNVGFFIMDEIIDNSHKELYYFRIQNHLRKMGLGRDSLLVFLSHKYFRKKKIKLNFIRPPSNALEVPSKKEKKYFEMLFHTVKSEVETIHTKG
jgi:hypothetical protein